MKYLSDDQIDLLEMYANEFETLRNRNDLSGIREWRQRIGRAFPEMKLEEILEKVRAILEGRWRKEMPKCSECNLKAKCSIRPILKAGKCSMATRDIVEKDIRESEKEASA